MEAQADMNDLAMKSVIKMVIGKEGGNFIHPFQMNRDNCHSEGTILGQSSLEVLALGKKYKARGEVRIIQNIQRG